MARVHAVNLAALPLIVALTAATPARAGTVRSVDDLAAFVTANAATLTSPAAMVTALVAADAPAFAGASLVYQSGSLQHASPSAPRLIAFSPDATATAPGTSPLVISVAPAEGDGGRLEAMAYDAAAGRYRFAEVSFPVAHDGSRHAQFAAEPPRCGACHGVPARPIWDTYHLWPGVYAGANEVIRADTPEMTNFQAFAASATTAPVYSHFQFATVSVPDLENGVLRSALSLSARPSLALGLTLSYGNLERVAHELMLGTGPRRVPLAHKYALVAVAGRCNLNNGELPAALYPPAFLQALGATPQAVATALQNHVVATNRTKQHAYFDFFGVPVPASVDTEILDFDISPPTLELDSALNFVADAIGPGGAWWAMENRPYSYALEDGYNGVDDLGAHVTTAALSDPELADFFTAFPGETATGLTAAACAELAKRSVAALAAVTPTPRAAGSITGDALDHDVEAQAPFVRCAACHGRAAMMAAPRAAPLIPFDDPVALATALKADGGALAQAIGARTAATVSAAQQMPPAPYAPLSGDERAALLDAVDYLGTVF